MKKELLQSIKIIVLGLILGLGVSFVSAWTGPTTGAPGGNVNPPLNVGESAQTKGGSLIISNSVVSNEDNLYAGYNPSTNSITGGLASGPAVFHDIIKVSGQANFYNKVIIGDTTSGGGQTPEVSFNSNIKSKGFFAKLSDFLGLGSGILETKEALAADYNPTTIGTFLNNSTCNDTCSFSETCTYIGWNFSSYSSSPAFKYFACIDLDNSQSLKLNASDNSVSQGGYVTITSEYEHSGKIYAGPYSYNPDYNSGLGIGCTLSSSPVNPIWNNTPVSYTNYSIPDGLYVAPFYHSSKVGQYSATLQLQQSTTFTVTCIRPSNNTTISKSVIVTVGNSGHILEVKGSSNLIGNVDVSGILNANGDVVLEDLKGSGERKICVDHDGKIKVCTNQ